jgi:hypothetical protein
MTASMLTLVGAEAVQQVAQGRDVQTITNQNAFSIDRNDGRTGTKDRSERVVPHADAAAGGGLV